MARNQQDPAEAERVAELQEQARADYGTPSERAERAGASRDGLAYTRMSASEAAGTARGR